MTMDPKKDLQWADQIIDPDVETDGIDDTEPTYRDGSVQNECWAEEGYTRDDRKEADD